MKRFLTKEGITGILFLITAVILFFLPNTKETVVDEFNIYWMFTFSALVLGVLLVLNQKGATVATYISRIVVGSLFVVSGLIKANDAKGFAYKLEEYFREDSLGSFWTIFHDWAMPLAVIIATAEVVLGLAVLLGGKSKLTNFTLLGMALFFAWLTYYTASCNDSQALFQADRAKKESVLKEECGDWLDYIHEDLSEGYLPEEIKAITDCKAKKEAIDVLNFGRECVNDCGCFGDALKGSIGRSLTPWESFYKDIFLLFYVIVLILRTSFIRLNTTKDDLTIGVFSLTAVGLFAGGLFGWLFPFWFSIGAFLVYLFLKRYYWSKIGQEWTIALGMIVFSLGFTMYTYTYLPIKDFRPYAIGKDINVERTDIPDKLKFYYKLKNKTTGEEKEFEAFPPNYEQEWEYVTFRNEVIEKGKEAPARDFSIVSMSDGADLSDSLLHAPELFIVVCYDMEHSDIEALNGIVELVKGPRSKGVPVIGMTATLEETTEKVISATGIDFEYFYGDEKVLKTMVRSNPGLMRIQNGVVVGKWPASALPDVSEIN